MELADEYTRRCQEDSDIVDHLPFLYDTVCRYPEAVVLEFGVRTGNSTAAFLAAAEAVEGHVWSVDVAKPHIPGWWAETGRWTLKVGNDTSQEIADAVPAEVDVLFIDTSHAYEHTLQELELYVPRVKPGGVVLCHDTELKEPEGCPTDPAFPVAKALDDYCEQTGMTWNNRSGCYGLGVLEVTRGSRRPVRLDS